MILPGMDYRIAMVFKHLEIHNESKRRIEFYSDGCLMKVYKNSRRAIEMLPSGRLEMYNFFGDPLYMPHDLFEGPAALSLLRERHGRKYTENLTGMAEMGFKGFLNRILGTSFKISSDRKG